MALHANELWSVRVRSVPVQVLSDHQGVDVYALPLNSSSRTGARVLGLGLRVVKLQ